METYPGGVSGLIRRPSGYLPIAMSLAALTLACAMVAVYGTAARQPDEGAAAHLFQLLVVAQLPVLAFFSVRFLRRDAAAALAVMGLHAVALAAALFPVWLFGL